MHAGRWAVIGIFAAAAGVVCLGYVLRRATRPRSIVLVTIDTLRADRLGAYGRSPSITPELDALAARGVVFERAWTTAPLTVPAHATLLTGLMPSQHGLRLNRPRAPLPAAPDRRFSTLAETLKDRGFATGAFVSGSVLRADDTGLAAGFGVYDEVPRAAPGALHESERSGEATVEKALAWARSEDGPVFLWVHLFDPHTPYDAPAGWGAGPAHVADAEGYDGEVRYADHCVGILLKGLADAGRGDAAVAVAADHGEALGEHGEPTHGYLLHEATLHVPLIFATPGLGTARRSEPVSTVDVFPTLLALAGVEIPPQGTRHAFFASGADRDMTVPPPPCAESLYAWDAFRWAQSFAIRIGNEKLVVSGPRRMVFDIAKDPREEHPAEPDAAQREAMVQLVAKLREPPLATMTAGPSVDPSLPYVSSGLADATPVLSDEENAKLASPYDRMGFLVKFDTACVLVSAGKAAEGLALLDEILAVDPGNPQFAFWRGRALEALHREAEGAEAYRHAFELGFHSAKCVDKALACSLKVMDLASQAGEAAKEAAEAGRADAFLAAARGAGSRDDVDTLVLEAFLRLRRGELDRCAEALDRAEKSPLTPRQRAGVDEGRDLLEKARKQPPKQR